MCFFLRSLLGLNGLDWPAGSAHKHDARRPGTADLHCSPAQPSLATVHNLA